MAMRSEGLGYGTIARSMNVTKSMVRESLKDSRKTMKFFRVILILRPKDFQPLLAGLTLFCLSTTSNEKLLLTSSS